MFKQRGFLAGIQLYAAIGVLVVIAGLVLSTAYYRNSAARAEAEATLARDQRDRAIEAVKASEEANAKLKALNASLDAAIVERDKRAKELEAARRKARQEIEELKKSLDEKDQACLDRDLPAARLERLRDGPSNPDPR